MSYKKAEDWAKKHYAGQDGSLNTGIIKEAIKEAKKNRGDWDDQAAKGWRIRNNELPLRLDRKSFEKWKDKYFKDNWVVKSITLKNSHLIGGDIFFELKRYDGEDSEDPVVSPLENEINFTHIFNRGIMEDIEVLKDWAYTGIGVTRDYFDPHSRSQYWITGKILHKHVDSRNIYILSEDGLCRDVYAIFYPTEFSVDYLQRKYPGLKDKLKETADVSEKGDGIHNKKTETVWTCLFKHDIPFKKREVRDTHAQKSYLYTLDEIDDMKTQLIKQYLGQIQPDENFRIINENFNKVVEEPSSSKFAEYVQQEEFTLEGMIIDQETITDVDTCWFQVLMTDNGIALPQESGKQKTEIKYTGEKSGFNFLPGHKQDGSQYPYGSAYFNADMLELKTLLMTSLSIMVMKYNKPMPIYEKGSLENEEEWLGGWWKPNIAAIVSPKWRKTVGENQKPFEYANAPFDKNTHITLDQIATESIKNQEGAVDSMRGVQQYSGQSGVQTAQLQAAATSYQKIDELLINDYFRSIGENYLSMIVKYRGHQHSVIDYAEDGTNKKMEVNTSPDTTYKMEEYYIQPIIEPTPELKRREMVEKAENLFSKGLMHPYDYIKAMNIPNADKIYQRSQTYQQLMAIQQLLEQNPQLMEIAQQNAQGAPQGNQESGQSSGAPNTPQDKINEARKRKETLQNQQ